jgi:hypothetical protein
MRVFLGVALGVLLFFPGILFLQFVASDVLGLYEQVTLTDGCLVMIIILLSVIIVTGASRNLLSPPRRYERWESLNGQRSSDERRADGEKPATSTSQSRTAARRRSVRDQVDVISLPGRSPREKTRTRDSHSTSERRTTRTRD